MNNHKFPARKEGRNCPHSREAPYNIVMNASIAPRTGAVQIYAHAANAAFAERLAAALEGSGYAIVTGPFDADAVDAVVVVWSGSAIGSERLLAAAEAPLHREALVAVSIGRIEPPPAFRAVDAVDLAGWQGEIGDPRWRRVLDRIEEAACRLDPAPVYVAPVEEHPAPPPPDIAALAGKWREAVAGLGARASAWPAAARSGLMTGGAYLAGRYRAARPAIAAVPRSPVAAGLAIAGALLLAGLLFISPNSEPARAPMAQAPQEGAPPLLASLEPAQETPPPTEAEPAREEARPSRAAAAEPKRAQEFADEAAEDDPTGAPLAEGDTDYPAASAPAQVAAAEAAPASGTGGAESEAAPPAAPSQAPAPDTDNIAMLIASSDPAAADPAGDETAAPQGAPGAVFRDYAACPEMKPLPAGTAKLGSPAREPARQPVEGPVTQVRIDEFAIGVKEVTFAEWDACVADGGCAEYAPADAGWGRAARPVVNVSWSDAKAYAEWLSAKTGKRYRLPSEAEWEYAARAGSETPFSFGAVVEAGQANFDAAHPYGGPAGKGRGRTMPAGSFSANPFGLYDMHGNVWEWVADCWSASHKGVPADGSPRAGECQRRVLKGGAWNTGGWRLRAGHRIPKAASAREFDNGFRVARDLD